MLVMPWPYLTLLTAGYVLALTYGQLSLQASIPITLLLLAGFAVQPQNHRYARYLGHSLFVLIAIALALHYLPGFHNAQVIEPQRFSDNAVPFSMYLNLDKPLLGFWLLLACPWLIAQRAFSPTLKTSAIALTLTAVATFTCAWLLGIIEWAPKWPDVARIWLLNNLLLVTLVEEALFRGYIQGGLSQRLKHLPYGEHLAVLLAATVFGLAHWGAGWQWVLLATLAGIGYGLAYRFGGLAAAIATHFGLNLLHFGLFTYPMLAG
ncbi:CPBP family intramembrane metalloprotease [Pseudomonas sp. TMW22090]|uniref:CPBP family intramembrane glutamic endopeptidase n=1 Tax=Pseudomonas sp. TMW22090 TaxID=2506434 RepID=UPI001F109690|nr:CPBP family intramembrane glutamic endopeptidase [Pseudomonas sp. TMW22090]MCH4880723.1 CPBP family intramembrane metalloprotease [Pseudomonas sp. TMW22090]